MEGMLLAGYGVHWTQGHDCCELFKTEEQARNFAQQIVMAGGHDGVYLSTLYRPIPKVYVGVDFANSSDLSLPPAVEP